MRGLLKLCHAPEAGGIFGFTPGRVEARVRRRSMASVMDQWIIATELAGFVS
jgi:hypothetical protein